MKLLIVLALAMASIGCFAQPQQPKPPVQHHEKKHKAAAETPAPSPTPESLDATKVRIGAGFVVVGFFMYWIPAIVASSRKHHNRGAITITNLLLGWTVIGWIAALIWACTNPAPALLAKGAGQ